VRNKLIHSFIHSSGPTSATFVGVSDHGANDGRGSALHGGVHERREGVDVSPASAGKCRLSEQARH